MAIRREIPRDAIAKAVAQRFGPKTDFVPYQGLTTRAAMTEFCRVANTSEAIVRKGRLDHLVAKFALNPCLPGTGGEGNRVEVHGKQVFDASGELLFGKRPPYEPYRGLTKRWQMEDFCRRHVRSGDPMSKKEAAVRAGYYDREVDLWCGDAEPEPQLPSLESDGDLQEGYHYRFSEEGC